MASDKVFQAVEKALLRFPFSYQGARILSGQEEGAFGWVTVNYLDDRLKQVCLNSAIYRSLHICPLKENVSGVLLLQRDFSAPLFLLQGLATTGALDLGGASTQISFVSDNYDISESSINSVTFRLYGNDYNLYTHSFLCYGKDQVLRMALAHQTKVNFRRLSLMI